MATVKVRMYATVRELAHTAELEIDAVDLDDLLQQLVGRFGSQFSELVNSAPEEGVVVLLNGRNVKAGSRPTIALSQGDEVCIFPPVSGG